MTKSNISLACDVFTLCFSEEPTHFFSAPGRVNIIGEHTDYNEGFVLPCAITFSTVIACRKNHSSTFRMIAANYDNQNDEFCIESPIVQSNHHWANYLRGVVNTLLSKHASLGGLDIVIAGDIPQGTGLSSSASLEVCFSYALNYLFRLGYNNTQLAQIAQHAENNFVGCNCGIMDQLISACGEAGSALMIDCRNLSTQAVEIPKELELLIINPNVERNLVGSEYNVRRSSCESAASSMGLNSLRDANMAMLEAHIDKMTDQTFSRARHVITENERVHSLVNAFKTKNYQAIHELFVASHKSMRDDFEITTPELDFIADTINNWLPNRGGARMTGGGFGGCAVALVPKEESKSISDNLIAAYRLKFNKTMSIYSPEISNGVHEVCRSTHKVSNY
jgi:galactokinase